MRKVLITAFSALVAFLAARADVDYGTSYFAPENFAICRMVLPDGGIRQFQRDTRDPNRFLSSDGWTGRLVGDGNLTICSAPSVNPPETYVYENGRLTRYESGLIRVNVPYGAPRKAPPLEISPLAVVTYENVEEAFSYERQEMEGKWLGTDRLAFPYVNPNQSGALYCLLALVALSLLAFRHIALRVLGFVLFAFFASLLVWTGSRGAMLALAAGLLPVLYCHRRDWLASKLFWCLALLACVGVSVWFACWGRDIFLRGFASTGTLDWSNRLRVDMWKAAPQMMADAPGGWGFAGVGLSYLNWYQPIEMLCLTGSLMNDHLTTLVRFGWCGRLCYLLVWGVVLSASLLTLVRAHRPVPLAASLALAVAAWFNPVFGCWGVWVAYALALWDICSLRRKIDRRTVVRAVCISVLGAGIVAVALCVTGSKASRTDGLLVHAEGDRVLVGGSDPEIWIVDDGQGALGGVLACKEMRMFYRTHSGTPAVGYVRRIEDLPHGGISRLTLVGKAATDWLLRLSENPSARTCLPKSVVLITPPFAPYEIPEGFLKCCAGRVVVGEFAARFQRDYDTARNWVTLVPGAERYIPNWMSYVLGE